MRKPHKFGAQAVVIDGIKFPSKREGARWCALRLLERAGEIRDLERQVRIPLMGRDGPLKSAAGRQLVYVADFRYFDVRAGAVVVEDSKGHETPDYKLKRSILAAQGVAILQT